MKYAVCVKQVPDVNAPWGSGRMVMNAYDASAMEAALTLVEAAGTGSIEVITVGPASASETIRKALAMGAQSATHLVVPDDAALDAMAFAKILASHLADADHDVILCGKQSQDMDAGLTGPMLATLVGVPYVSNAVGLSQEGAELVVLRQADGGQEQIGITPRCLVTCSNDMNDPRIPSIKGIMTAKRIQIETVAVDVEAVVGPTKTQLHSIDPLPDPEPGVQFDGEIEEVVPALYTALRDEARVLA
jgi:electron transfer flavoprotein beta subunit